ncbi:MAG: nitrilase-related carbon-nitrogen hydrolase, partial [Catalinimonas sp.]
RPYYDVLLCVANWPAVRQAAWEALLRARAVENLAYAVGCNRVGRDGKGVAYAGGSGVYGPFGDTLLTAEPGAGLLAVTLDHAVLEAHRRAFPAHLDADAFTLDVQHDA